MVITLGLITRLLHEGQTNFAETLIEITKNIKNQLTDEEHIYFCETFGVLLKNSGKYDMAMLYFTKIVEISNKIDNKLSKAMALNMLGLISKLQHNTNSAITKLSEALEITITEIKIKDQLTEADEIHHLLHLQSNILLNKAAILKEQYIEGNFKDISLLNEAEALLNKAKDVSFMQRDNFSLLRIYGNLANIYEIKGKEFNQHQEKYLLEALRLSKEIKDQHKQIVSYANLINFYGSNNNLNQMESILNVALQLNIKQYPLVHGNIYKYLFIAYHKNGLIEKAQHAYEIAIEAFQLSPELKTELINLTELKETIS